MTFAAALPLKNKIVIASWVTGFKYLNTDTFHHTETWAKYMLYHLQAGMHEELKRAFMNMMCVTNVLLNKSRAYQIIYSRYVENYSYFRLKGF